MYRIWEKIPGFPSSLSSVRWHVQSKFTRRCCCLGVCVFCFLICYSVFATLGALHLPYFTVYQKDQTQVINTSSNMCASIHSKHVRNSRRVQYPEAAYFKPRPQTVNIHPYEFLLKAAALCSNKAPFLVIVIPSVYHHISQRQAIRNTWASVSRTPSWPDGTELPQIVVLFIFGIIPTIKSNHILKEEQEKFGDIVQENFVDTYPNLTIKMVGALRWVSEYCNTAEFILKADEDVFVNVPLLVRKLQTSEHDVMLGHVESDSQVQRYGRWNVMKTEYPYDRYPDYLQGNSYVIPGCLSTKLYNISRYLPYLPIEDVFITGILSKTIGIKLENVVGFTFNVEPPPSPCDFVRLNIITKTNVNIKDMYTIWNSYFPNTTCYNT